MARVFTVALAAFVALSAPFPIEAQSPPVTLHGIPMSGTAVPRLAAFDEAITDYMSRNDISAGALAITNGTEIVFERGYGWTSAEHSQYLRPDALFRLASITKPVTKAAIRQLATAGRLQLTDFAICTGSNQPCHLSITPYRTPDARLGAITVRHLLEHTGGWDRDITSDLTYQYTAASRDLGVAMPPSREDMARWIAGRPLDFAPGARYAYANVGYLYLGLIVEKVAGMPWFDYVRREIFEPSGVSGSQILHGRTLRADRDSREPAYEDPFVWTSVFPPHPWVPQPDGSFHFESRIGIGNIVTTARSMARFLTRYKVNGERIAGNLASDWHTGSYSGTNTLLRQYTSGVGLAVYFNRSVDAAGNAHDIDDLRTLLDSTVNQMNFSGLSALAAPDPSAPMATPPSSSGPPRPALTATPTPSPVPMSATQIEGCGGSNGSWTLQIALQESAGVATTLVERVNMLDGREANRFAMSTRLAGRGRTTLSSSWCAAAASAHTLQVQYTAIDGYGNRQTFSTPVVQLLPR